MTDLHDLLDVASRPASADGWDVTHDIATEVCLGRRALRRRRIAAAGGGTVAAGFVVGTAVSAAALLGGPGTGTAPVAPAGSPTASWQADATVTGRASASPTRSAPTASPSSSSTSWPAAVLTNAPAQAGPFRYGRTPAGWVAGASTTYVGNLVPAAGATPNDSTNVTGKITGKITAMIATRASANTTSFVQGQGWMAEHPVTVGGKPMTLILQVPESVNLTADDFGLLLEAITVGADAVPAMG